jgi:putative nucleotidyltransferase with HDIG domain
MIELMDKAMVAFQAAATARTLYGPAHPAARRQMDLAAETLVTILAARGELRLVRLDNALLFEDTDLPSSVTLAAALVPLLAAHGVEWIEFRNGLAQPELLSFLEQLERAAAAGADIGTPHIRAGRLGRGGGGHVIGSGGGFTGADVGGGSGEGGGAAGAVSRLALLGLDRDEQSAQLRQVWAALRAGTGPVKDNGLADLVESIRLAVAVGADVCNQLAEVKNHDEYTFVHTVNVAILSAALGEAVGMNNNQVFELILAALLHDVGKQRTPLTILNKPGQLDDAERRRMQQHTIDGAALLLGRRGVPDVAPIVAFEHHANIDGTGYPILGRAARPHLASQIVHVADVFDALRTNRPYRAALDEAKVRGILLEGSGKQFEPGLVDLFLEYVVKLPPGQGAAPAPGKIIVPTTAVVNDAKG